MTNYTYAAGDPQPARIPGLTAEVPPTAGEASTVSQCGAEEATEQQTNQHCHRHTVPTGN